MATVMFLYGLPNQLIVAESPDVIEGIIADAVAEGDRMYVGFHSQGSYLDMSAIDHEDIRRLSPEQLVGMGERRDSFTDMRVRLDLIVAFRDAHPGEVIE